MVRLNGTSGKDEAVLVNAHYGKMNYMQKKKKKIKIDILSNYR